MHNNSVMSTQGHSHLELGHVINQKVTRPRLEGMDVKCTWVQQKDYYREEPKINYVVEIEMNNRTKYKLKLPQCPCHTPPKFKYIPQLTTTQGTSG